MNNGKIRVIFYGVGAIGSEVAKFGLTRPWLEVVGAIDSDPAKVGRDLGAVPGLGKTLGVEVSSGPAALRDAARVPTIDNVFTNRRMPHSLSEYEKTIAS